MANIHPSAGNLATYGYGYDVDNTTGQSSMLGQRSSLTATVPPQNFNNSLTKYYYDSNYQLTRSDYPNVAPFSAETDSWTYDAIGNRLTNTVNASTQNYAYFKNGSNQLNGQELQSDSINSYTYDPNGNTKTQVTPGGTYTFSWSTHNMMTAISGPVTASYVMDYIDRRKSKTVTGVQTKYLYDGQNLIRETGAATADYLIGPGIDEPLAMSRSGSIFYYDVDGLGSATLVNNSTGTMQDSYVMDAWGIMRSQTAAVANPFMYTARETSEAGLIYYRARHYNPGIGRFISEDRLHWAPKSMYAYVANTPLQFVDPSGDLPSWVAGPIAGGGTGGLGLIDFLWGFQCYRCAKDQYVDGWRQFPKIVQPDEHMRHCWTSCQVTKRCGDICFNYVSIGNEIVGQFQWHDLVANEKGHQIARRKEDCYHGCSNCIPGGPPGPPAPPPPPAEGPGPCQGENCVHR